MLEMNSFMNMYLLSLLLSDFKYPHRYNLKRVCVSLAISAAITTL